MQANQLGDVFVEVLQKQAILDFLHIIKQKIKIKFPLKFNLGNFFKTLKKNPPLVLEQKVSNG